MASFIDFVTSIAPIAPLLSVAAASVSAYIAYRSIRLNGAIHRERMAHENRRAQAARAGTTYRYLVADPLQRYLEDLLEWSRTWLDPKVRSLAETARGNPGARSSAAGAFVRAAQAELNVLRWHLAIGVNSTADTQLRARVNAAFQAVTDGLGQIVREWAKNPRTPLTAATFRPLLQRHGEALFTAVAERDPELLMLASGDASSPGASLLPAPRSP